MSFRYWGFQVGKLSVVWIDLLTQTHHEIQPGVWVPHYGRRRLGWCVPEVRWGRL